MGNSRGSWKGNTLVVDVTNIKGGNWLDQVGNFFSDNAHVVERFTLADANTIDYEVTIDDAKVFTRPWTVRLPLRRARAAGGDKYANETWENACHEGNQATEHNRRLGFKWFRGVTPPNYRAGAAKCVRTVGFGRQPRLRRGSRAAAQASSEGSLEPTYSTSVRGEASLEEMVP